MGFIWYLLEFHCNDEVTSIFIVHFVIIIIIIIILLLLLLLLFYYYYYYYYYYYLFNYLISILNACKFHLFFYHLIKL